MYHDTFIQMKLLQMLNKLCELQRNLIKDIYLENVKSKQGTLSEVCSTG